MRKVKNDIPLQSTGGVVSVLTGLRAERSGVRMPEGYGTLLSFKSSKHALGPTQRDDNRSPSSRTEVRNE
jgi:hypothetical protein